LITGGSRGIGASIARQLARHGICVAVGYQSQQEQAQQLAADIRRAGGRAVAIGGDVRDEKQVDRLFGTAEQELGHIEVLINNAGVHIGGRLGRLHFSDWRTVIDTNLTGAFLCARRALPSMLERGHGRIINISSVIGINGYPGDAPYASAKAGLIGFTRALALELASAGITVNAVAPGFVDTDMTRALGTAMTDRLEQSVPLRRQARADEIAEAVSFLATGTEYITGSVLVVDGGWTIAAGR
jgi:3-oxoacyl-[acyl-carrier protein] reductase